MINTDSLIAKELKKKLEAICDETHNYACQLNTRDEICILRMMEDSGNVYAELNWNKGEKLHEIKEISVIDFITDKDASDRVERTLEFLSRQLGCKCMFVKVREDTPEYRVYQSRGYIDYGVKDKNGSVLLIKNMPPIRYKGDYDTLPWGS